MMQFYISYKNYRFVIIYGTHIFLDLYNLSLYDRSLRIGDNFISEKIEKILLELLEDNKTLTEFVLQGNRISLSCLSRIKKIMQRNEKEIEGKEPSRLKVELYKLQNEEKKLLEEKMKLNQQERDIIRYQDTKESLKNEMQKYQINEDLKRTNMNERIDEQKAIFARKKEVFEEKNEDLNRV